MAKHRPETNLASEFYVLSLLYRGGFDATLTLGNKKSVDIVVVLAEGRAATIDVKAVAGKNDWLLGDSEPRVAAEHFVALVTYDGAFDKLDSLPRVWIVPSTKLAQHTKIAGNGKTRYISRSAFIAGGAQYQNAWSTLSA